MPPKEDPNKKSRRASKFASSILNRFRKASREEISQSQSSANQTQAQHSGTNAEPNDPRGDQSSFLQRLHAGPSRTRTAQDFTSGEVERDHRDAIESQMAARRREEIQRNLQTESEASERRRRIEDDGQPGRSEGGAAGKGRPVDMSEVKGKGKGKKKDDLQ